MRTSPRGKDQLATRPQGTPAKGEPIMKRVPYTLDPSNDDRAQWAKVGIDAFAKETGLDNEELETAVSDFLADLMHFCDQEKIDFNLCLSRGQGHYLEERAEERASQSLELHFLP